MTSTEPDHLFDRAMKCRDRGEWAEARRLLHDLLAQLDPDEKKLRAHSHLQLGNIAEHLDDFAEAEREFRRATQIAPKLELASMALFHALNEQSRAPEALDEMLRFATQRDSAMYRELVEEGALKEVRERRLVAPELVDEIEAMLAKWATA